MYSKKELKKVAANSAKEAIKDYKKTVQEEEEKKKREDPMNRVHVAALDAIKEIKHASRMISGHKKSKHKKEKQKKEKSTKKQTKEKEQHEHVPKLKEKHVHFGQED